METVSPPCIPPPESSVCRSDLEKKVAMMRHTLSPRHTYWTAMLLVEQAHGVLQALAGALHGFESQDSHQGGTCPLRRQASEEQSKSLQAFLLGTLSSSPCALPTSSPPPSVTWKTRGGGGARARRLTLKLCLILSTPFSAFLDGLQREACHLDKLNLTRKSILIKSAVPS